MFVIVGCDSDLLVLQDAASVPVEAGVEDQVNLAATGSYGLTIPGCTGPSLTPPRNVAVINLSVFVFAKHRLQMLIHFQECTMAANAAKIEVPQIKIFTALLSGLTRIIEEGGRGQLWRGGGDQRRYEPLRPRPHLHQPAAALRRGRVPQEDLTGNDDIRCGF